MRMRFKVKYDDGREVEAVAKPKDCVAFERQYNKSMAAFADESAPAHLEWVFYMAWSPLHRQGRAPEAFDEWLNTVDDIEEIAEPEPDPTQPAASEESLPS